VVGGLKGRRKRLNSLWISSQSGRSYALKRACGLLPRSKAQPADLTCTLILEGNTRRVASFDLRTCASLFHHPLEGFEDRASSLGVVANEMSGGRGKSRFMTSPLPVSPSCFATMRADPPPQGRVSKKQRFSSNTNRFKQACGTLFNGTIFRRSLLAMLCGTATGSAQSLATPARSRPVAPRHVPRGARLPPGMSFDRLRTDLKQTGGSRTGCRSGRIVEASTYLRLRPGTSNRDRGPARMRASVHRVRRPPGRELPDSSGPGPGSRLTPRDPSRRRRGILALPNGGDLGVLGAGERRAKARRQHGRPCDDELAGRWP